MLHTTQPKSSSVLKKGHKVLFEHSYYVIKDQIKTIKNINPPVKYKCFILNLMKSEHIFGENEEGTYFLTKKRKMKDLNSKETKIFSQRGVLKIRWHLGCTNC